MNPNRKYEIYSYYENELKHIVDEIEEEREQTFWKKVRDWFKEILSIQTYLRKYQ